MSGRCNRQPDKIDRLAIRFKRDSLRWPAIVRQSRRVQMERSTVVNTGAAETAAIVVRDVVACVGNWRSTTPAQFRCHLASRPESCSSAVAVLWFQMPPPKPAARVAEKVLVGDSQQGYVKMAPPAEEGALLPRRVLLMIVSEPSSLRWRRRRPPLLPEKVCADRQRLRDDARRCQTT